MAAIYATSFANPASQHAEGRDAARLLDEAQDGIREILGASSLYPAPDQIVFTAGGTEANNLALRGLCGAPPGRILVSAVEHPSVAEAGNYLASQGFEVCRVAVSTAGVLDLEHLSRCLKAPTRLVSVMLGNHETGVLQPVAEVARLCREQGVPVHTDAVQCAGKVEVDFAGLGVDAMSVSAHKFHGPPGIGVLVLRHPIRPDPILFGGRQQAGMRPGTQPVALAQGMWKALQLWRQEAVARADRLRQLRDQIERGLQWEFPELIVHGIGVPRLPHVLSVSFPGLDRQGLLMALDRAGVACSTGTTCSSGSSEPSQVLLAMGCPRALTDSALRFSLGATTSAEEAGEALSRITDVVRRMRRLGGATKPREMASEPV
jgi:cysteine desulfurase